MLRANEEPEPEEIEVSDELVKLPDDSANTGKQIDNTLLTVGGQPVIRQRVQLGGDDAVELVAVSNTTPAGTEYGLLVRTVGPSAVTLASVPLPSGAATEATLAAIAAALAGTLAVAGTVSIGSSALPSGAATEITLAAIAAALAGTLAVSGSVSVGSSALPSGAATQATLASILTALGAALTVTGSVTVGSSALPTGAATESTLAGIKTGTDKIPASPATDRTAAGGPASARLSDGSAFYDAAKTGQLPSALSGGKLDAAATPTGDAVVVAGAALTPKFKVVNITASADLIALVSSKKLRVLAMFVVANLDGTIALQSGASSALTGTMTVRQGGGFVLPYNPLGWFETVAGEKLNAVLATITQLSGSITYIEV